LVSGLNTKLAVNKRPPFEPTSGLSTKDLDNAWLTLEKSEHERQIALRDELRRQKKIQDLLRKFNQISGKLESWSAERQTALRSTEYGDTVSAVQAKINNLDAFESEWHAQTARVDQLRSISDQLSQQGFNDMPYVQNRISGIDHTWTGLKTDSANRRAALEAHLQKLQQIENDLLEFAKRGLEFRVWLENADDTLTDPITVETVQGINELHQGFDRFVAEKEGKTSEYHSLEQLAQRLKDLGVAENTYSEVSWASLQSGWNNVNGLVETRRSQLVSEQQSQEHNEQLRVDFATKAKNFSSFIKEQSSKIESLSGEIQAQIDSLHAISSDVSSGSSHYDELVQLTHQLDSAGVSDNPHTDLTIEGLKAQYEALTVLHKKKLEILEKELLAQSGSGLTPAQMQEFRECFKHFDKDEDNLLSRLELGACLKSLGEDINFDQGGKLDQILNAIDGDSDGKVTFEEFVGYMERVSSGSDTPDSIKSAFKTIAGDKDYITEADLRSVLPNEKVEYILARIKPYHGMSNAYDYSTFTDTLYA